jgi:hypothetical protein
MGIPAAKAPCCRARADDTYPADTVIVPATVERESMTQPLYVQVCLRPFTPQEVQERQQEVLDRLAVMKSDGDVETEVVWWSPRVCPPDSEGPFSGGCPDVVRELVALADREGFSLAPSSRNTPARFRAKVTR